MLVYHAPFALYIQYIFIEYLLCANLHGLYYGRHYRISEGIEHI